MNDYPVYPEQSGEEDRPVLPYSPVWNTLRTALVARVAGCWPSESIRYRETKSDHLLLISNVCMIF